MQIGNIEITQEQMPSYVRPEEMDYHIYLSMQDALGNKLMQQQSSQVQPMPQQNNMMQPPAWNQGQQ